MTSTYENVWASLTVFANERITALKDTDPSYDIRYIDWESANVNELPDSDLIGPTAVTIEDEGQEQISVTFAIGVSTYTSDTNLFRLRRFVGSVFEAMRPEKQINYYNAELAVQRSKFVVTGGTLIAPMTRMDVRPWQFVQAAVLLVPS
jgi:hypothetical protein